MKCGRHRQNRHCLYIIYTKTRVKFTPLLELIQLLENNSVGDGMQRLGPVSEPRDANYLGVWGMATRQVKETNQAPQVYSLRSSSYSLHQSSLHNNKTKKSQQSIPHLPHLDVKVDVFLVYINLALFEGMMNCAFVLSLGARSSESKTKRNRERGQEREFDLSQICVISGRTIENISYSATFDGWDMWAQTNRCFNPVS
ncbi:hypothetical protein GQR58_026840 [Nymphon striatum]|nr:hypothetical protein GQR58_026840 [Nymphon striatum]